MSKIAKIGIVVAVIAVVVGVGIAVGWFGGSKPAAASVESGNTGEIARAEANSRPTVSSAPKEIGKSKSAKRHSAGAGSNVAAGIQGSATAGLANPTNAIPDWEDKVDAILTSDGEDADKAKKMMEMFPKLAPDAQEEVAHHLSNLTPDEDYTPLGNLLTNSTLAEPVLDVFMEDVLNRPNTVKLPLLLEVAENPQHPGAQEAKDVLELFLEEDYGSDWPKWQAKMQEWLKENPD